MSPAGIAALVFSSAAALAGSDGHLSARWDAAEGWQEQRLGATLRPNRFEIQAETGVLRINSQSSMSLWARPLAVDLASRPVLCWRWRISAPLQSADMSKKAGDDYAARLYIAFRLPPQSLDWPTRAQLAIARRLYGEAVPDAALNYVWDNRHPVGHHAPNAYTGQTRMVVQRSGAAQAGQWVQERRHLAEDARTWLPAGAQPVLVAVAADTDNTGESVVAEFAGLKLVGAQDRCD
ncbi:DUF3047 domain-containing protein [Kinneretia asaccharophila]|uniref:DUF3047 family protein n=1 Tax=Roseateles asaccharophilus TaxID=582607 RepID=A0A4R6N334_9BURK|nr:DUF3047 domain-containing protein [Roseateles asaccharophilus]MDN3544183.1 DUF3047 domain-containing protein [Roseateles asaccharophilus]TDP09223.1 DUF3047 family protein [Roseateles asaccharophilus]